MIQNHEKEVKLKDSKLSLTGIYISIKTLNSEELSNIKNTGFMQYITKEGVLIG